MEQCGHKAPNCPRCSLPTDPTRVGAQFMAPPRPDEDFFLGRPVAAGIGVHGTPYGSTALGACR